MSARTRTLFSDFILCFRAFHIFRPKPRQNGRRRHRPIRDDGRKCSRLNLGAMVAELTPGVMKSVQAAGTSTKRYAMVDSSNELMRLLPGKEVREYDLQQYGGCLAVRR